MRLQYSLSIISALLENVFFSGIVFGWPMLRYVLGEYGYFHDACPITASNTTNVSSPALCEEQESRLNLVFTLTSNIMLIGSFFLGYMLDRFGMWIFRSFITFNFSLGCVFLVISSPNASNFMFPGMVLLGTGGIGLLLSNLQLVQLAPTYQGIVATMINGMFDSAPVVFLLIKKISNSGIHLTSIFQVMTSLTILPWIKTFLLMPKKSIPVPLPPRYRYGWQEFICFKKKEKQVNNNSITFSSTTDLDCKSNCNIEQVHGTKVTFKDCLRNKLFWTNCFHFTVITFRVNFFIGSLVEWVKHILKSKNEAGNYAGALGIWLLFSSVASPLNGIIIDTVIKFSKSYLNDKRLLNIRGLSVSMLVTSLLSILLSAMVLIPSVYGSYACLLFLKTFVYGGSSALLILLFPPEHLGKLYGLNNIIAGSVGMLQFLLFKVSQNGQHEFEYIHIGFCVLTVITLVHPFMLYRKSRKA